MTNVSNEIAQHTDELKMLGAQILEADERLAEMKAQRAKLAERRHEVRMIIATLQFVERKAAAEKAEQESKAAAEFAAPPDPAE
jgi:septal ring factor EnvC (AmiA/AmiB activator)